RRRRRDRRRVARVLRPDRRRCRVTRPAGEGLSDQERYDQGMVVRREVLSDAHVDRSIANTTDLTADFQDFITRVAWGDIWSRPGLDRRSRSVAVLTA